MNTQEQIERHQMCIQILEAIQHFENVKNHKQESISALGGMLPELRKKYINELDTYNRCIERLNQRYLTVKLKFYLNEAIDNTVNVQQYVCDVCGSDDVIEAPHMGRNCNRCNPL